MKLLLEVARLMSSSSWYVEMVLDITEEGENHSERRLTLLYSSRKIRQSVHNCFKPFKQTVYLIRWYKTLIIIIEASVGWLEICESLDEERNESLR